MTKNKQWQPIETCPKTGKFDVWMSNGEGRFTDCHWERGGIAKHHGSPQYTSYFTTQPTHWMPIPKSPKFIAKARGEA